MNTDAFLALDDFEEAARTFLPRPLFGYIKGGAETGASVRANREAFASFAFVTRVLRDISTRSISRELLGHTFAAPCMGWSHPAGMAYGRLLPHLAQTRHAAFREQLTRARSAGPVVESSAGLCRPQQNDLGPHPPHSRRVERTFGIERAAVRG